MAPGVSRGKEAPILRDCLKWLHTRGVFAWRNNTGMYWANGRPVYYGKRGSADILGLTPDGRFLSIETKRPKGGKQSDKQQEFQAKIEANHGVYLLVRSVEELEEQWLQKRLSPFSTAL
jgi:hypothetical protein